MINSAVPSPASAAAASSSSSTASAQSSLTQNFNTFLTLLTTQLQNQDPLSPLDSSQFTQQLVSFSEVEQQINTNSNLTQLIQLQNVNEQIAALPLVGDTIQYSSATAPLQNGSASWSYTLPNAANTVGLVVQDSSGNTVFTTTGTTNAGNNNFTWNGQMSDGQTAPAGSYTLQVQALGPNNATITPTIAANGQVNSIDQANGSASFNVGGLQVPMSELIAITGSSSLAGAANQVANQAAAAAQSTVGSTVQSAANSVGSTVQSAVNSVVQAFTSH